MLINSCSIQVEFNFVILLAEFRYQLGIFSFLNQHIWEGIE